MYKGTEEAIQLNSKHTVIPNTTLVLWYKLFMAEVVIATPSLLLTLSAGSKQSVAEQLANQIGSSYYRPGSTHIT